MPKHGIGAASLILSLLALGFVSAAVPSDLKPNRPRNLVAPRIAGLPITGQTLSAHRGAWSQSPTRYRYVWQRCGKAGRSCRRVSRGSSSKYLISRRDVGHRLRIVVMASNRAGSTSARSRLTASVTRGGVATKSPPPAGGYFGLQPVGAWSRLPSGASCARLVHRSTWEPRPDNNKRNHIVPDATAVHQAFAARPLAVDNNYDRRWDRWLLPRVDGQFTGTTDEIFQWGACKWGLSDDMLRAIAVEESTWYQYLAYPSNRCVSYYGCGDFFGASSAASTVFCNAIARYGYDYQRDYGPGLCPQTFSIVGIKAWQAPSWGRMPDNQNGTFPFSRDSTAFAVDYISAFLRGCYEGWEHWLRTAGTPTYAAGDVWGCVGSWFSGDWHSAGAERYVSRVRADISDRTWLQPGWPRDRPPCSSHGCPGPDKL